MKLATKYVPLIILAVLLIGILAACTAKTPAAEEAALATEISAPVEEATSEPVKELTQEPTAEPRPTALPTAVPTPTALPELKVDAFNAWCMPAGYGKLPEVTSSAMLENGRAATVKGDMMTLLYPDSVCVFSFTFNQAAPQGLSLAWLNKTGADVPWLETPLQADPQNNAIAFGTETHTYVISPPLWGVDYKLRLLAEDGTSLWEDAIHMGRDWQPELCWNGVLPDPVTLLCIKQQDLHPWDPGYCMYNTCP